MGKGRKLEVFSFRREGGGRPLNVANSSLLFILCVRVCACVCTHTATSRTGAADSCEPHYEFWELNVGPLQEQPMSQTPTPQLPHRGGFLKQECEGQEGARHPGSGAGSSLILLL